MDERSKNIRRRVNTPTADQSTTDPLLRQTQTGDEVGTSLHSLFKTNLIWKPFLVELVSWPQYVLKELDKITR